MVGADVEYCLEHLTLVVDTREQHTEQSEHRYKQTGMPYIRRKLNAGDYSVQVLSSGNEIILLDEKVAIERKMSLDELANCFCQGRDRFMREFERAKSLGTRVYLLVENGSWDAIYQHRYKSKMHPKAFLGSLIALMTQYDVNVVFCSSTSSGQMIGNILKREAERILIEYE